MARLLESTTRYPVLTGIATGVGLVSGAAVRKFMLPSDGIPVRIFRVVIATGIAATIVNNSLRGTRGRRKQQYTAGLAGSFFGALVSEFLPFGRNE